MTRLSAINRLIPIYGMNGKFKWQVVKSVESGWMMEALHEAVTRSEPYISFEEFLKLYDGQHAEWLNGKVEVVVANNATHNEILMFMVSLLQLFVGFKPVGRFQLAGFTMYVGDKQPAREPDILFVLNEHLDRFTPTYLNGAADMVLEIVSPESVERDYGKKFIEYEKAGVSEYWLFDPIRQIARIYVLGEDKVYHPADSDAEGRLVSTLLPGFRLDPALLWRQQMPQGAELIQLVQDMLS